MIKVRLVSNTDADPIVLAQFGANVCYDKEAVFGESNINVEKGLFDKGHHTTLQHWFATFLVEGIAVSDITFGFHLTHPFYNSGQRSGRYCASMFNDKDYDETIKKYVRKFWPEISEIQMKNVADYVKFGVETYKANISQAGNLTLDYLMKERPKVPAEVSAELKRKGFKGHKDNALKIAQEQMRVFIPTIFPTGFLHTLNLTALAALYETAWTPAMKYATGEMARLVLEKFPQLSFLFKKNRRKDHKWSIKIPRVKLIPIARKPRLKKMKISGESNFVFAAAGMKHPLDKLHFSPEMMDNSASGAEMEIETSVATMGQDQRHRTIGRGSAKFTGGFYMPPIISELGMEKQAEILMRKWINLSREVPETLAMCLAPYGATVKYKKRASFNAFLHEQGKRSCWLAQEEIYHLSRSFRLAIAKEKGKNSPLLAIFDPPCRQTGICGEGSRYCGREIGVRLSGDYFPNRKI